MKYEVISEVTCDRCSEAPVVRGVGEDAIRFFCRKHALRQYGDDRRMERWTTLDYWAEDIETMRAALRECP